MMTIRNKDVAPAVSGASMRECRKLGAWALVVAMGLGFSGCAEKQAVEIPMTSVDGDPDAPFVVTTSVRGAVEPGAKLAMTLKVRTHVPLMAWRVGLRGVDGVEVGDGDEREHGTVAAGAAVERTVEVVAREGVHGLVAVDIAWQSKEGARSTTVALPVWARGAKAKTPALGVVKDDGRGGKVQVMAAEIR